MDENVIAEILINNGMFEELVNYNFVYDRTVRKLFEFVYKGCIYVYDPGFAFVQFLESDRRDVSVFKKQLKEMLFSWDKIENRHALATLWTLLAKRGDLKKIFDAEQAQK